MLQDEWRDRFALAALHAILQAPDFHTNMHEKGIADPAKIVAVAAYDYADAMMKARGR